MGHPGQPPLLEQLREEPLGQVRRLVGIVTLSDLFALIYQMAHEWPEDFYKQINQMKHRSVQEIMSKNVLSISPKTPLSEIVDIVIKWRIHTFPVLDKGRLVGIIGRHDVLNAAFAYG